MNLVDSNVELMSVTAAVDHRDRSWLNMSFPLNSRCKDVTFVTFQNGMCPYFLVMSALDAVIAVEHTDRP